MGIKRRKRRKKKVSKNVFWLPILTITVSVILLGFLKTIPIRSEIRLINEKSLNNIPLTPIPTLAPTFTPTPTPIPLIGYCLNVPILMYHHIQPDSEASARGQKALSVDNGAFDLQMGYLVSNGYSVVSVGQLTNALVSHTPLPSKSIVITIDDAYNDIYTYAFPVLRKYGIVANLGVITGLVNGADYVSWGQVEEMSRSGLMQMVNHTWSHYSITQDPDKAKYEIATAKQQLQDHTGQNIDTFIYPYGAINSSAVAALQQEGIRSAFSAIPGHWQCDSFLMSLHRNRIGNGSLSNYGL